MFITFNVEQTLLSDLVHAFGTKIKGYSQRTRMGANYNAKWYINKEPKLKEQRCKGINKETRNKMKKD